MQQSLNEQPQKYIKKKILKGMSFKHRLNFAPATTKDTVYYTYE